MTKASPLRIHIPQPCHQDWNTMKPQNGGRYCNHCTKVVHDFSQMTDTELIQFFKTKPVELCGRFHHQQLNREIKPVVAKQSFPVYFKKIAAAVFAVLTFRSVTAQVQKGTDKPATTQTSLTGKNSLPETVTISGTVTKGNNIPVPNARVAIDSVVEVYTDAEGKFSIQLSGEKITTHNLYFSYDGLEPAVRNFHPLMGSTSYDVRLTSKEDYQQYFFQGLISAPFTNSLEFSVIQFKNHIIQLSEAAKTSLEDDVMKLKSNPQVTIKIVGYAHSTKHRKYAKLKAELVYDYFLKRGISTDRLTLLIESGMPENYVDIIQDL